MARAARAPLLSAASGVARALLAGWAACVLVRVGAAAHSAGDGDQHVEAATGAHASPGWSYEGDHGPDNWPGHCQTGKIQSPIDIITEKAKSSSFDPLVIAHAEKRTKGVLTNNGHTVDISLEGSHSMVLSGAGLHKTFRLNGVHFHWASEHTVNDERFALEAHFVFYDERQESFASALGVPKSIAVLGVLFRQSEKHNPAFDRVNVTGLADVDASREIMCSLKDLLPENKEKYYRYRGSLTTPPCTEQVTWTVFAETLHISKKQLAEFRKLLNSDGKPMASNYRPTQSMRNHTIYYHELSSGAYGNIYSKEIQSYTILTLSVITLVKLF